MTGTPRTQRRRRGAGLRCIAALALLAASAIGCMVNRDIMHPVETGDLDDRGDDLQCRRFGVDLYCSRGPESSILKLDTGVVVCGDGPCKENRDGSYSCAPSRWAKITRRPGDVGYSCFQNGRRAHCERPSRSRCVSP